jgi:SAM-dependent methyltransferase
MKEARMQAMERAATAALDAPTAPAALGRPSFRWSDIWKAPLHDLPIRDEILYQYLPLAPDMSVLEVGPGSGFTAFRLSRHVRRLTLVDIGADNVAQLRRVLRSRENVEVVCADACQPGLASAVGTRFDAAFALEVFELLPDPAACLVNFAEVLRPDGHLLVQFPNYPPPQNPGVTWFPTRADLDRLMEAAGFRSWEVFSLNLRPHASTLYHELHERPLQLYRRFRDRRNGHDHKPLTYDTTWAFRQRHRLEPYKYVLHGMWSALVAASRLGGPCFERERLGDEILGKNLLLMARR